MIAKNCVTDIGQGFRDLNIYQYSSANNEKWIRYNTLLPSILITFIISSAKT